MLYSIKYFHSVRNVFLIKASFQQKSDFMSFSLKRCIQACQFSPICLKVSVLSGKHAHTQMSYRIHAAASNARHTALSWVG